MNDVWLKLVELVEDLSEQNLPTPMVEIIDDGHLLMHFPATGECSGYYWHDNDWQLEEGSRGNSGRAE